MSNKILAVNLGGDRVIVETAAGIGYLANIRRAVRWHPMPMAALTLGDEFTTVLPADLPTLAEIESYTLLGKPAAA